MKYKPSMFNYSFASDIGMMIFNSRMGVKSIFLVSKENENKVESMISRNGEEIEYDKSNTDILVKTLIHYGYFVPSDLDEKCLREKYINDCINDEVLDVVIHTSRNCNFRCKYCYMDFKPENMNAETEKKIIDFVASKLTKCSGLSVSWFGGEPLMGVGTIERLSAKFIELCHTMKKPYKASITTNGYLLSPTIINTLIKNKVTTFTVTIDGLKKNHDLLRVQKSGEGSFDQIISNLLYIRDHIKTRTITCYIRSNVTSAFLPYIQEYYSYFNGLFGKDKRFSFFIRPVDDWGGESVKELWSELISYSDTYRIYRSLAEVIDINGLKPALSSLVNGGASCSAMNRNKYTISVNGNVSKCDEASDKEDALMIGKCSGTIKVNEELDAKWMFAHIPYTEKCNSCFYSIPCLKNGCQKYSVINNALACPLDLDELNGYIILAWVCNGKPIIG